MIIEKLKKEDMESYKELMDECFGSSNEISYYQNNYDYNSDKYQILVTKDMDKIVGSVTFYKLDLFTFSFQPSLEIFNVAVLKDYRGRKIAKQLFEEVVNYSIKNGYKSIVLTCLDTAYDAHRLYESLGFKKTDSLKYARYL